MIRSLSLILLLGLLCGKQVFAQNCSCEQNFAWVQKTFEENDAGFGYVLQKKGRAAYESHNETALAAVRKAATVQECGEAMRSWLQFFRKGHFAINPTDSLWAVVSQQAPKPPSPDRIAKHPRYEISDQAFDKYLAGLKHAGFEGLWKSAPYTIGIIRQGDAYVGFIVDAPGTSWQKNQVKLRIFPAAGGFKGTLYLRDFCKQDSIAIDTLGSNVLTLGPLSMQRLKPQYPETQEVKDYIEFLTAQDPYIRRLSGKTLYLRIPTFEQREKKKIDSLIAANHAWLSSTPNLIIDLRNNGGGSDDSYYEITPYLYTDPIRVTGVEMYSTKLNNQVLLDYAAHPDLSPEQQKSLKKSYDKLNERLGQFVQMKENKVSVHARDTVYAYPKTVAILVNEHCGSTTEEFLLEAKQSRKVKLFGTSTYGALDISNMNFVASPCGDYELGYCRSRSLRIPEFMIDGVGLQPDYYMDSSIPKSQWVGFVWKMLDSETK